MLNTNVNGSRKVMYALCQIRGIGRRFANLICKKVRTMHARARSRNRPRALRRGPQPMQLRLDRSAILDAARMDSIGCDTTDLSACAASPPRNRLAAIGIAHVPPHRPSPHRPLSIRVARNPPAPSDLQGNCCRIFAGRAFSSLSATGSNPHCRLLSILADASPFSLCRCAASARYCLCVG